MQTDKRLWSYAALIAVLTVHGCSSDDEEGNGQCDAHRTLAKAECALLQRCNPSWFPLFRDVDQCTERAIMARLGSDRGLLSFSGHGITAKRAKSCADALRKASCHEIADVVASDACTFPGTLPNGHECQSSDDCSSFYCRYANGPTEGGKCAAPAREGESCAELQCARGLTCNNAKHCTLSEPSSAKLGEPCKVDPNEAGNYCTSGLRCVARTCAELGKLGEQCSTQGAYSACAGLLYCAAGMNSNSGVCREQTFGGDGDYCRWPNAMCGAGLYCSVDESRCRPYTPDGGSCSDWAECLYPAMCVGAEGSSEERRCLIGGQVTWQCE